MHLSLAATWLSIGQAGNHAAVHVLPNLALAALGLSVVWLLARRSNFLAVPTLLAASGASMLVLGSLVETIMRLAGALPAAGDPGLLSTRATWQVGGLVLLAAGVIWSAWRRPGDGGPWDDRPAGRCPVRRTKSGLVAPTVARGCAACRDRTLAQVCVLSPGRTIVGATQAFAEAVGRGPADLVGLPLETVLDLPLGTLEVGTGPGGIEGAGAGVVGGPPVRAPGEGADEAEGPMSVRAALLPVSEASRPVLATLTRHPSDKGEVACIAVQDASPLLRAECRARDAETLQRAVADVTPVAILTVAREGTIRDANQAATRLFGLPRQSLVGRSFAVLIERVAAERVDAERFITRAWHDRATTLSLLVRRPGHQPYPVALLARSFWQLPEPVLLVFGRGRAYERRLERQLAGTHRLSVLGRLFSGTAHDVNNILTTILAWTQWLQRSWMPAQAREPLRLIEQAAADGAHIVRRSLDLARGRRRDEPQAADLNRVLADALAMCRSRIQQSGGPIRTETQLASSAITRGHVSELRELLINLILNAVDAMPHGGTLRLATRCDAETVQLAVTDTGHGMDAAVRHRMFEPFFTTKGHRGSGLGLALVRRIAARHRATIAVDTEPGRGTTVRLGLPRASRDPRKRALPVTPRSSPLRTGRVLVVDDKEPIQRVVEDILVQAGHQVRSADSGRQALVACRRREFDCVLIDLHMPDVDGARLASEARRLDPGVALVALSGSLDTSETVPGPFDFALPKPFDLDRLLEVVGAAVDLSAGRRRGIAARPAASDSPAARV